MGRRRTCERLSVPSSPQLFIIFLDTGGQGLSQVQIQSPQSHSHQPQEQCYPGMDFFMTLGCSLQTYVPCLCRRPAALIHLLGGGLGSPLQMPSRTRALIISPWVPGNAALCSLAPFFPGSFRPSHPRVNL